MEYEEEEKRRAMELLARANGRLRRCEIQVRSAVEEFQCAKQEARQASEHLERMDKLMLERRNHAPLARPKNSALTAASRKTPRRSLVIIKFLERTLRASQQA